MRETLRGGNDRQHGRRNVACVASEPVPAPAPPHAPPASPAPSARDDRRSRASHLEENGCRGIRRHGETERTRRATRAGYVADMVEQQGHDRHVVVVGAGMVAHRFVESLRSRDPDGLWRVTVIGEEDRHPYDRVGLTSFFAGASAGRPDARSARSSTTTTACGSCAATRSPASTARRAASRPTSGLSVGYDTLVLATGSYAARLTVDGFDLERMLRLPHPRRRRGSARVRRAALRRARPPAARHGDRRRAARARGGRRDAGARRRLHRRAVLGPADVGAARRARRGLAAPAHRVARHRGAAPAASPPASTRTSAATSAASSSARATTPTPTSSSSPSACGRATSSRGPPS